MPTKRTVVALVGALLPLALGFSSAGLVAFDRAARSRPGGGAATIGPQAAPAPPGGTAPAGRGTVIHLATGAFDPLRGVPDVPHDRRAARPGHWLVQVHSRAGPAVSRTPSGTRSWARGS